jgi:hypothetical protein
MSNIQKVVQLESNQERQSYYVFLLEGDEIFISKDKDETITMRADGRLRFTPETKLMFFNEVQRFHDDRISRFSNEIFNLILNSIKLEISLNQMKIHTTGTKEIIKIIQKKIRELFC